MSIDSLRRHISGIRDRPFKQQRVGQTMGAVGWRSDKPEASALDEQLVCAARCFLRRVGS
jgi:hypothetical protein